MVSGSFSNIADTACISHRRFESERSIGTRIDEQETTGDAVIASRLLLGQVLY